jgi:ABC-2 type transport system permease protein
MTGVRQGWLVALREMRERGRSRAFVATLIVSLLVIVGLIVVPALAESGGGPKDVGLTGATPARLSQAISSQGEVAGTTVRLHRYAALDLGEDALRNGDVDVLVVSGRRLEWQGKRDEQLRGVVTSAIQQVAIVDRAAAAGLAPEQLLAIVAPVPVQNVEIGFVAGRSVDDETATMVISVLLLTAIITYGNLVLTGVAEEKASRVVEVLLARMPARSLLTGKVAGIGLLGFGQFAITALAAFVALMFVDTVDIPAAGGGVLAWAVVWFLLGYALYAMAYGALGSLASRTEDAQSVAGPVSYALLGGYWASFVAISADPEGPWSLVLSYFPPTAPLAMPARIALGLAAWWEPFLAALLTLAAIVALVRLGGRIYERSILHMGSTLQLRDVWRRPSSAKAGEEHALR